MIKVFLRIRNPADPYIEMDETTITIGDTKTKFSQIFSDKANQLQVYSNICADTANRAIMGGMKACIFAYGQTGSGKTHTMTGSGDISDMTNINIGIIPRLARDLLTVISEQRGHGAVIRGVITDDIFLNEDTIKYQTKLQVPLLRVRCVEIYNEKVRDLLSLDADVLEIPHDDSSLKPESVKSPLKHVAIQKPVNSHRGPKEVKIREGPGGVLVQNVTEWEVHDLYSVIQLLLLTMKRRVVSANSVNERSSRSHTIWTFLLETYGSPSIINLIDLAGSEKPEGGPLSPLMTEGCSINQSLSTLRLVVKELSNRSRIMEREQRNNTVGCNKEINTNESNKKEKYHHIPFRSSKLTLLLKDMLDGDVTMVTTINGSKDHYSETVSSLIFASCAAKVRIIVSNSTASQVKKEGNSKNDCTDLYNKFIEEKNVEIRNLEKEIRKLKENEKSSKITQVGVSDRTEDDSTKKALEKMIKRHNEAQSLLSYWGNMEKDSHGGAKIDNKKNDDIRNLVSGFVTRLHFSSHKEKIKRMITGGIVDIQRNGVIDPGQEVYKNNQLENVVGNCESEHMRMIRCSPCYASLYRSSEIFISGSSSCEPTRNGLLTLENNRTCFMDSDGDRREPDEGSSRENKSIWDVLLHRFVLSNRESTNEIMQFPHSILHELCISVDRSNEIIELMTRTYPHFISRLMSSRTDTDSQSASGGTLRFSCFLILPSDIYFFEFDDIDGAQYNLSTNRKKNGMKITELLFGVAMVINVEGTNRRSVMTTLEFHNLLTKLSSLDLNIENDNISVLRSIFGLPNKSKNDGIENIISVRNTSHISRNLTASLPRTNQVNNQNRKKSDHIEHRIQKEYNGVDILSDSEHFSSSNSEVCSSIFSVEDIEIRERTNVELEIDDDPLVLIRDIRKIVKRDFQ